MTDAKIMDCCRWLVFRNKRRPLPADVVEDIFFEANRLHRKRLGVPLMNMETVVLQNEEISFEAADLYRNDYVGGLTGDEKRSLAYAMTRVMP